MPRNSSGLYQLPAGTVAVPNTLIQSEKYNTFIADIGDEMTASLPRDGRAAMTGKLGLIDGSSSNPAAQFASAPQTGFYFDPIGNAVVFVIGGVEVGRFSLSGITGGMPIGTPIHVLDDTLPPLCIWADGRNVSRTTYAALFAKWADKYGAGDGSTTFGMPDLRGAPLVGRDNIGGTDANRLASVPTVSGDRLTTGSVIGASLHTLTQAQLPAVAPTGTVTAPINNITAITAIGSVSAAPGAGSASAGPVTSSIPVTYNSGPTFTGNAIGSGAAHNNVQRSFLCNVAIYAGA